MHTFSGTTNTSANQKGKKEYFPASIQYYVIVFIAISDCYAEYQTDILCELRVKNL